MLQAFLVLLHTLLLLLVALPRFLRVLFLVPFLAEVGITCARTVRALFRRHSDTMTVRSDEQSLRMRSKCCATKNGDRAGGVAALFARVRITNYLLALKCLPYLSVAIALHTSFHHPPKAPFRVTRVYRRLAITKIILYKNKSLLLLSGGQRS